MLAAPSVAGPVGASVEGTPIRVVADAPSQPSSRWANQETPVSVNSDAPVSASSARHSSSERRAIVA